MTEIPPDDLDERASAYLDGEMSVEERARATSDAALAPRAAELDAVRQALSAPVEGPGDDAREAAIAAALAHRPISADAGRPGTVVAWRTKPPRRWLPAAVAAGVVAAAIGGVVWAQRRGQEVTSTGAAGSASERASSGSTSPANAGKTGPGASTTVGSARPAKGAGTPSSLPALGALQTAADVRRALIPLQGAPPTAGSSSNTVQPGAATSEGATTGAGARTTSATERATTTATTAVAGAASTAAVPGARAPEDTATSCPPPDSGARLVATAVWRGRPVWVYLDRSRVELVGMRDCQALAEVALP